MHIRDVMTKAPTCCSPDTKLDQVARLMLEHDCGEIPVCDGARLIGVVTDRDLVCRGFAKRRNPLDVAVFDVMTSKVYTVNEDDDVDVAIGVMEDHQIRRVPVTREGKIIGIVSQADLVTKLPAAKSADLLKAISRPAGVTV